MNKTYGDMMGEYENLKSSAQRFSSWNGLDKFVEELIKQIQPKVEKPATVPLHSFDANGSEIDG